MASAGLFVGRDSCPVLYIKKGAPPYRALTVWGEGGVDRFFIWGGADSAAGGRFRMRRCRISPVKAVYAAGPVFVRRCTTQAGRRWAEGQKSPAIHRMAGLRRWQVQKD